MTADDGHTGKVLGIGLFKSGTSSLNAALEWLGLRSIHYPADEQTREAIMHCLDVGCTRLELGVLESCDALTDVPVCAVYQALDRAYPGSRFVLTVRPKDAWLRSCAAYDERLGLSAWLRDAPDDPLARYLAAVRRKLFSTVAFDADAFADGYDRYHAEVHETFRDRPHQLLTLDFSSGAGWPELCGFLGRPEPRAPFPFENESPATAGARTAALGDLLEAMVPAGATVALIDGGLGLQPPGELRVIDFCRSQGWWGEPGDSAQAVRAADELAAQGADWIVLLEPALWWLDFYRDFAADLERRSREVVRDPRAVGFRLR